MPVKKMWTWLEKEFPNKYDAYKIVLSPLINGAHNTQKYSANGFTEIAMFVCGVEREKEQNKNLLEGIMSGIVFTEIDHNYVNPVSDKYAKQIDEVFKERTKWTDSSENANLYNSSYAVFNEYMTHALFCLYAYLNYSKDDFEKVNKLREDLMITKRGFLRFKEFNNELLKLYISKKQGETVTDLYPKILQWAREQ